LTERSYQVARLNTAKSRRPVIILVSGMMSVPVPVEESPFVVELLNVKMLQACHHLYSTSCLTVQVANDFVTPNLTLESSCQTRSLLPQSVRTTLAQLRSGHCRHTRPASPSTCQSCPLRLTVQDLRAQTGRGRTLPQPGQLTISRELLGYHNNNKWVSRHLLTTAMKQGVPAWNDPEAGFSPWRSVTNHLLYFLSLLYCIFLL